MYCPQTFVAFVASCEPMSLKPARKIWYSNQSASTGRSQPGHFDDMVPTFVFVCFLVSSFCPKLRLLFGGEEPPTVGSAKTDFQIYRGTNEGYQCQVYMCSARKRKRSHRAWYQGGKREKDVLKEWIMFASGVETVDEMQPPSIWARCR